VLAVQNGTFREQLAALIKEIGFNLEVIGAPGAIRQLTCEQHAKSWVILDTEDDVASLVQLVNDYHRSPFHIGGTAAIICIVSEQAITENRSLSFWLVDGSAAVFSVWSRSSDFHLDLRSLFRFVSKEPISHTEPDRPTYEDLITCVLQAPADGQRLLDRGVRLNEWQDSHRTRYELARTLFWHAVTLMPESAEAHRWYGTSLSRTHQEEGLSHLREAVRLAPDAADGYLALGQFLADIDGAEALKALLKAIQLDPEGNSGRMARNVIASRQLAGA
jgi:tetratricopeptide (TPR) repeat protein